MERRNGLQQSTVRGQERSRPQGKLPDNFPSQDSTVEEAGAYLLGSHQYSHKGFKARIPGSHSLNHNSRH